MKKAAIISPFFYPELIGSAPYNFDLATKLMKENINVEVYCSHPLYPKWKPKKGRTELNGIKLYRGGLWLRYPKNNILRRLILELWFFLFIFKNLSRIKKNNLVFIIFPPSLLALAFFFLRNDTKIIGIVHDLQSIHLGSNNFLKKFIGKFIKFFEKIAFGLCESLIFLSAEMRNEASSVYKVANDKCKVVYPSITIKEFNNLNNLSGVFDESMFNIVYSGALGQKQNPDSIFNAAESLIKTNSKIKFYFFSSGKEFDRLKRKNSFENIIFQDLVKKEDLPELLLRSDLQIISQIKGSSKGSLPSKLPNILASGAPVLSITDEESELQKILQDQEGCFVLNEWDIQKISEVIDSLSIKENQRYDRTNKLDEFMPDYIMQSIRKMIS